MAPLLRRTLVWSIAEGVSIGMFWLLLNETVPARLGLKEKV